MTPVLYVDEKRVASPPLRRGTSQRHQDLVAASVGMNYFVAAHLKTPSDLDVTKVALFTRAHPFHFAIKIILVLSFVLVNFPCAVVHAASSSIQPQAARKFTPL